MLNSNDLLHLKFLTCSNCYMQFCCIYERYIISVMYLRHVSCMLQVVTSIVNIFFINIIESLQTIFSGTLNGTSGFQ